MPTMDEDRDSKKEGDFFKVMDNIIAVLGPEPRSPYPQFMLSPLHQIDDDLYLPSHTVHSHS